MVGKNRVNIVVPTIRDADHFHEFLENWVDEFKGCHLIVIEDREKKKLKNLIEDAARQCDFTCEVYDWTDIDADLKEDAWIIPRQTDVVRNYGYLVAYRNDPLFILTLDDDVKPAGRDYIARHYTNLFQIKGNTDYVSTMSDRRVRGSEVFEDTQEVVVSHSGWLTNPDFSAKEQIKGLSTATYDSNYGDFFDGVLPKGYYSMCGMALAWKPKVTKWMYFPMQGMKDWGIDRCGDIWAGFYCKNKSDKEGYCHYSGAPFVEHTRASNIWSSLEKEEDSDVKGRAFINWLEHDITDSYMEDYFKQLDKAYIIWERLIHESDINSGKIPRKYSMDFRV